jgi:YidC/Oxa1 family membrane protein insertase
MNFLINLFNLILYQPLFNALILFYEFLPGHDFGLAIIVLTVLIRLALYPSSLKSIQSQKTMAEIQPKIQEIQRTYKNDQAKQAQAMMELYQKEKINPFSGCLPLLLQLPILIALYQVFWRGLQPEQLANLYSFVPHPGQINPFFLGIVNLSQPNLIFALLSGALQFFQTKMLNPKQKEHFPKPKDDTASQFSEMIQKEMLYIFPIFAVLILLRLPSAIGLYWIITTLFAIIQQYIIFKKPKSVASNATS